MKAKKTVLIESDAFGLKFKAESTLLNEIPPAWNQEKQPFDLDSVSQTLDLSTFRIRHRNCDHSYRVPMETKHAQSVCQMIDQKRERRHRESERNKTGFELENKEQKKSEFAPYPFLVNLPCFVCDKNFNHTPSKHREIYMTLVRRYFPPGVTTRRESKKRIFTRKFEEFNATQKTPIGLKMAARMYYYTFLERLDCE